ncbi:hypothetical protein CDD81_7382 [Ophiocordyceps australis]|uniref:GEgh 16 protein n=1 Tax=Ophiocordyceps australis TaxID=1399860 RepID=A0A2C5XGW0_9HYPO|nr:hypothetical protein CDD81_7382 [Ophiocordyceps australis]
MYFSSLIASSSFAALASCHGVILDAQGLKGSPSSVGFQVDPAIARNCINISPCQQDTTIIRDAEIDANVVNQCGRTQLKGNIDVGENTENAIAEGKVTEVEPGTEMQVTIHQVNADGAGPYTCDLDETSNTGVISQNLTVTNNVPGSNGLSQAKAQAFTISVKMPDQFTCTGASTGDICTVRCRNNALAGPFGGCFPVRLAGAKGQSNNANSIRTADPANKITDQILVNQAGFQDAVQANKNSSSDQAEQSLKAVDALLANSVVSANFPVETAPIDVDDNNGGGNNNDGGNNNNGGGNNKGKGKGNKKNNKNGGQNNGNTGNTGNDDATDNNGQGATGGKNRNKQNGNTGNTGNDDVTDNNGQGVTGGKNRNAAGGSNKNRQSGGGNTGADDTDSNTNIGNSQTGSNNKNNKNNNANIGADSTAGTGNSRTGSGRNSQIGNSASSRSSSRNSGNSQSSRQKGSDGFQKRQSPRSIPHGPRGPLDSRDLDSAHAIPHNERRSLKSFFA